MREHRPTAPARRSTVERVVSSFKDRLGLKRPTPSAPPRRKEEPLYEPATQIARAFIAEKNGERVTFWLRLHEQTTARDVQLVWTQSRATSDEPAYQYSKVFRWDAADPTVDPSERIGFKALCHLVQATGLPLHFNWTLNVPAFLQRHHGWHEVFKPPGRKPRTVTGKFEELKSVAPEEFAHLQFPSGYGLD